MQEKWFKKHILDGSGTGLCVSRFKPVFPHK